MPSAPLPLVSLIKALAAQLILWHHFSLYGPMAEAVAPMVTALSDWLLDHGRLAVQVFLVCGGFLSGRALLNRATPLQWRHLPGELSRRYRRLIGPYAAGILLAVATAALARYLIVDESTPDAPDLLQLLAHLALLTDIVSVDALSAGVWYVAIDFQLHALLCLLVVLGGRHAVPLIAVGTVISLVWFNRQPALDEWGIYFFGAYGLGVLAAWIAPREKRTLHLGALIGVVVLALAIDWRSRILIAGTTALALALSGGRTPRWLPRHPIIDSLADRSYALFLVHYPMLMLVGSLIHSAWPEVPLANGLGLGLAWTASMFAADALYRTLERPRRPIPACQPA